MKRIIICVLTVWIVSGFVTLEGDEVISVLKERIALQNRTMLRAKLDLLFHQPRYSPGDTAFVRTLYLGAADLKPIAGRELVYVELHDQNGSVVLNEHFVLKNGWSSNKLAIPENLAPGIYVVVAYTDWMKNEDSSLFYRQDFLVTGPNAIQKEEITGNASLEFYPEGGKLVAGIENFMTVRRRGSRDNATVVLKEGEEEIARTNCDRNDLLTFRFTPQPGRTYRTEVINGNDIMKVNLPSPEPEGFTIHVSSNKSQNLAVRITASTGVANKRRYYLTLCNSQGLVFITKLDFEKSRELAFVLPSGLPEGVAEFTVVDENFKAWLHRPVYIEGFPEYTIEFQQLKNTYATREDVSVLVHVKNKAGKPVRGYFSASITNEEIFNDSTGRVGPSQNLLLYSDISSTFKLNYPTDHSGLLQYLSTQTCPWLKWDEIESGKIKAPTIPPKTNLILSGRVSIAESGKPVPDSTTVMFFLQKQMVGYERLILKNGMFNFPVLFDFSGTDYALYIASRKGRDIRGITIKLDKIDSNYSFKSSASKITDSEDTYGKFNQQKKMIDRSYGFFARLKDQTDSTADLNHFIETELNGADITFKTKDYILFPTMPDLIREVLKAVDLRKIRGQDIVRVYTTNKLPTSYATPLYVIDGVMTKEASAFLNLIPSEIISIKVIRNESKLARWRSMGANGIILVRTTNPEAIREKIKPDYVFPVIGTALSYSGDDSEQSKNEQTPDLRASLQWSANVILDDQGTAILRFKTSDDAARFTIHLDGMSAAGFPFSKNNSFMVRYNPQP
jgi:hypothetical protein